SHLPARSAPSAPSLHDALPISLRSHAPGAVEALVRTLRTLVEGEARQLALRGSTAFTQEDALTIAAKKTGSLFAWCGEAGAHQRSEEHTSELQSHLNLVCRLLL